GLEKGKRVHTTDIASSMDVSPPTVTEMMRKLAERGLVDYEPYRGVVLTEKGRKIAVGLERDHRILAEFLRLIGVDAETAEMDACEIEHHVAKDTMLHLSRFLEFLKSCDAEIGWMERFHGGEMSCSPRDEDRGKAGEKRGL
ncbi:MAG: metal-dependent transcriptional regulator, partial [Thermoplasmata archaeon]|nr:metal-dependent transcriptional regulator [Thermoplasmata archaeon]